METFSAVSQRRSIRRFSGREIPKELVEKILCAAILAPSAKNRQPWKFIVISGKEKDSMLKAVKCGIENEKRGNGLLPHYTRFISGAENTVKIMEQAPVTVFVFNTEAGTLWDSASAVSIESKLADIANIQSVGAAIENMILAATDLGIGSLWICDIFFAYREICAWLGEKNQLTAAVSLGYADESPYPRPRKKLDDVVTWR